MYTFLATNEKLAPFAKQQIIKLCDLTIDHLDNFLEEKTPKLLLLVHK